MSKQEQEKILRHVIQDWHLGSMDIYGDCAEYDGKEYSGISVLFTLDDKLDEIIVYQGGAEAGIKRKWHENGRIKEESLRWGNTNGYIRKWNSDGKIFYEAIYIEGFCIYDINVNKKGEVEEFFDSKSLNGLRESYYCGAIRKVESSCPLAERHFIDSAYMNGILEIFEKYREVEVENDILLNKIIKYAKEVNTQRYEKFLIFDRVVNEVELQLKDGIIYLHNEKYTGLSARILDDDNLTCTVILSICGYENGKKQGFELLWDPEEILNPEGLKKYGYNEGENYWWSKGLLRESIYYESGEVIEHYEWENKLV